MKNLFLLFVFSLISWHIQSQDFIRTELNTSVSTPWEITYGPDNFLWLTESGGRVSRVDPTNGNKTVVYTAPDYFQGSTQETSSLCPHLAIGSGTLGLALHPNFLDSSKSFIYFVYSYNNGSVTTPSTKFRIKRLKWDNSSNTIINDTNIVDSITTGYDHLGGRLLAINQNNIPYLFLSIGDNGRSEMNEPNCYNPQTTNPNNFTQDITTQNGKIHRYNIDGSIPFDNPISGNSFFTRGHRNPQGLMYNPNLDLLYNIEHGDRTDDEINILYKGMNYGWKDVRGYHNDNSYPGESTFVANYIPNPSITNDSLVEPLYSWCTSQDTSSLYLDWCTVAPSDGIYYEYNTIPNWTNSLLVVTLKNGTYTDQELYQFKLEPNGSLTPSTTGNPNPKKFFGSDQSLNGRLRDIAVSNDGMTIYLINNGGTANDKITVYSYDTTFIGINEMKKNEVIQLNPNPAHEHLTIKGLDDLYNVKAIQISTLYGKLISTEKLNSNRINISKLAKGIYFLNIICEDVIYTLKFIKT